MSSTRSSLARMLMWVSLACAATALTVTRAQAEALLVIDVENGKVLYAHNAGNPWYPASVTKLMTAYVTLRAVNEGRINLDTPLVVSANAAAQSPVKMGFAVGTVVTVDNALKMLMVKSANDMAVVLAEGVAGSIESFADEMNATARRLGMIQSSFVNPNGLPADDQITSARDLASGTSAPKLRRSGIGGATWTSWVRRATRTPGARGPRAGRPTAAAVSMLICLWDEQRRWV